MEDLHRGGAVHLASGRKEVADEGRCLLGRQPLDEQLSRRLVEDPGDLGHFERLGWIRGRTWDFT